MLAEHFFGMWPVILFIALMFLVSAVLWPVGVVRAAINERLTKKSKIIWILCQLFVFFMPSIYLIVIDKNRFLKILGVLVVIAYAACLAIPDTREILLTVLGSKTAESDLMHKMQAIKSDADLSSEALCAACTSADPNDESICLEHISNHLVIIKHEPHPVYCSNEGEVTIQAAKEQFSAWCKKVGPNYPFPSPRWRTMYAALSEKYPCNGAPAAVPAK